MFVDLKYSKLKITVSYNVFDIHAVKPGLSFSDSYKSWT